MDEILGPRIARLHQGDFEAMDHELGARTPAELSGQPEVIRMNMRDQYPPDSLYRDLKLIELCLEGLSGFVRLQTGIDQCEAIAVANQVDVDMAQLERHRKLEPIDSVDHLHGAYVTGARGRLSGRLCFFGPVRQRLLALVLSGQRQVHRVGGD